MGVLVFDLPDDVTTVLSLAVLAVMLLGKGALKDDDGPRHGYGGYLFVARKPTS